MAKSIEDEIIVMKKSDVQVLFIDCLNSWAKYNPSLAAALTALTQSPQNSRGVIPKHYMTREEAAKLLGVSLHTLNKWTKEGKLKGYRIGSRVRYVASELENSLTEIAV